MKYAYACKQYDYRATTKYSLDQHKRAVHERVKYACRQYDHKATSKSSLGIQKRKEQFTKEWSNCTSNVTVRQLQNIVFLYPWWINRNNIYPQKYNKHFMSMFDQQKLHTEAIRKQNILCPWWIKWNHINWQKHRKYFMSMMDQMKSHILAKAQQNISCPRWIDANHIYWQK